MKLYLMQHGKPVSKEEDPQRKLSSQGIDEVKKVAKFLGEKGIVVDSIIHSGKVRARQTAEIVATRLNPGKQPQERNNISPMDDTKILADDIKEMKNDLMIVGHLPYLARLSSFLIIGATSLPVVTFKQGGVLCLSRDKDFIWTISWMLVPEII
jgi:phosphohistidine phosphatase